MYICEFCSYIKVTHPRSLIKFCRPVILGSNYTVDSRYNERRGEIENSSLYRDIVISKNLKIVWVLLVKY